MGNSSVGLDVFSLLAEPVRKALAAMGFSAPTAPQAEAIPAVLKGENVLLIAPTGSGKTEAALLPVLSNLLRLPERKGISVLFITPLRALNRDMVRRLSYWADFLGFSVEVRHGDTEIKIRRRQALRPPDMLVTTPETLQAILPGSVMQRHLSRVRFVVIDEVHELAEDKRGVQLAVALERLREVTGVDFQRIGLSATIGDPDEAAKFIAGTDRKIIVINVLTPKGYQYGVEYPVPQDADYDAAHDLGTSPEAVARIRRIIDLVNKHVSTLIFVNSRTNAEALGHRLSRLSSEVAVHHGSLSREERTLIEDQFKAKSLKAIVCTSTLELGIDIGHVDLVVQYLSPRRVSSLIQRVGRSGHRLGMTSKGTVITAFTDDTLEAIAATRRAYKNLLEPICIHENALDVLAHQIVGILMDQGQMALDQAFAIVQRAYPYRNISKVKFLDVVEYLEHLRELRVEGDLLKKAKRTRSYYYENLSMIADERRYPIIDIVSDRKIGTLGDEFMALRARVGLNFICRGKVWRIVQIEDETGDVYVVPSEDPMAAIPGWDGEIQPVHFSLAQEVGKIRHEIAEELKRSGNPEKVAEIFAEKYSNEKSVLGDVVGEIHEHTRQGIPVPTHVRAVIEGFDKYIIVHMCFGETVNRTFGCILDAILSDREMIAGWWNDGYRILIEAPRNIENQDLKRFTDMLSSLSDEEIDHAFNAYLKARFPFAYKMKFIAERFGALPRGRTMGPARLAQLPTRFEGTPIYDETLREAMLEKVDLASVKKMISSIRSGTTSISTIFRSDEPSPIAYHILSQYADISEFMAPKQVLMSNFKRMKMAISSRNVRLLCLSCGQWSTEIRVRDMAHKPTCKECGSGLLTCLNRGQDPEDVRDLLRRRLDREQLTEDEMKELTHARRVADLVLSYGKSAIIALQVRGVGPETAFRILGKMHVSEDEFYVDLLKAKIQFLKTRQYWDNNKKV